MLNRVKIERELSRAIYLRLLISWVEKINEVLFGQEGTAHDAHDFVDISVKFHPMLNDGHKAISRDGCIDLDADGSLGCAPEGLDTKMLLYPFEEQLHLPTILIQENYLLGRQIEIVCVEDERSMELRDICHNATYLGWVILHVALCGKLYSLILKDVLILNHVVATDHFVPGLPLFAYDKEGVNLLNMVKTSQIPVAPVKYITSQRLICDIIHCVDIVNVSIRNTEECRDIGDDIYLGVELDAGLGTSKLCPVEDTHAKVYGRRIEGIEATVEFKLAAYTQALCQRNHMHGERLEYVIVTQGIGFGKHTAVDRCLAKSEMIRLLPVRCGDVGKFTQASTTLQLSEYENEQLVPICKLPTAGFVYMFFHDSFEFAFWEKIDNLTEDISSLVHENGYFGVIPKGSNFKCATRVLRDKSFKTNNQKSKLTNFSRH